MKLLGGSIEISLFQSIRSKITSKGNNYIRKPSKLFRIQYKLETAKSNKSNHRPQNHRGGGGTAAAQLETTANRAARP